MGDKFDILGQAKQQRDQEQMLAFKKAVEDSPYIVCNCGNGTFVQAHFLKNVSGLRTGNGVDLIVPQQIFICANCGTIISGYEDNISIYPDRFDVTTGREVETPEVKKEISNEEIPENLETLPFDNRSFDTLPTDVDELVS
jgi:hypothetical protein